MRLENCALDVAGAAMAPPFRNAPEDVWVIARDSGAMPGSLFDLYTRASYLSFGAAPPFMKDEEHVLFSYFGMLLRSVMNALVEADDELRLLLEAQAQIYDPGKRIRGETWDPTAEERARRHFRHFVLSLQAALDGFSDTSALFFTGLVPDLRLGRAQFSRLEGWLARPLPVPGLIDCGFSFLNVAFQTFQAFSTNRAALAELNGVPNSMRSSTFLIALTTAMANCRIHPPTFGRG